jgi:ribosomal protein S18 acetylase RimI-like enzyme
VSRIEYRRASTADAAPIAEVHRLSHRETYVPLVGEENYHPPDAKARLAQWKGALSGPGVAVVALQGGQVVGFTHALGGKITTLYVLAAYHRRGIGRNLLRLILEALAERGHATARFDVLDLNAKAIAFYESQGTRMVGRAKGEAAGYSDKELLDDLLFEIPTAKG